MPFVHAQWDGITPVSPAVTGPVAPPVISNTSKAFDFGSALNDTFNTMDKAFRNMPQAALNTASGPGIQQLALTFGWVFGLLALILPTMKATLGSGSPVEEFIEALLPIGIFSALILNYPQLANAIKDMFEDLSKSILGSQPGMIATVIVLIKNMIAGFMENIPSAWDVITKSIGYFIMVIVLGLLSIITSFIAFFFILIYTNVGRGLMAIAIALGPIFLACGVWKVTRPFFEKWLHFFLIAGMYQVVSAVIVTLISQVSFMPAGTTPQDFASVPYALETLLNMATLAYLTSIIPDICSGLMPGQLSGASGAGKLAVKAATGGAGGGSGGGGKGGGGSGGSGGASSAP